MSKKWLCFSCEGDITLGQKFTFLSKGPVHLECLYKEIVSRGVFKGDVELLFNALSIILDEIIRFREFKESSESKDIQEIFYELQKAAEVNAAKLTRKLESLVDL